MVPLAGLKDTCTAVFWCPGQMTSPGKGVKEVSGMFHAAEVEACDAV